MQAEQLAWRGPPCAQAHTLPKHRAPGTLPHKLPGVLRYHTGLLRGADHPPSRQISEQDGALHTKEHLQRRLAACPGQGRNYLSPEIQGSPAIVNNANLKLPFTKRLLHSSTCSKRTIIGHPKPRNKRHYFKRAGNRPPPCRHTFYVFSMLFFGHPGAGCNIKPHNAQSRAILTFSLT